jgi:hypothetical protein
MISHYDYQLALRQKLLTLEVATTGSISIEATATGYTRATGSFITDGFAVGMEVVGTGFSDADNNEAKTITAVTALTMDADGCAVEAAGSRTLSVALPEIRLWENIPATPIMDRPYVTEQYLPGPTLKETLGTFAELELRPMYVVTIHAVANRGLAAAAKYADAILELFAPGTAMTATNGDTLRVRNDVGPYRGQLLQESPGWAFVPVNIPLRVRSTNSV